MRVGDGERTLTSGCCALELAEQDGHDDAAGPVDAPSSSVPVSSPSPSAVELLEELLLEREHPLRVAVEPPPGLGRLDAAARAVEQLPAEPLLERPDLQADGRLRDAEPLRRL